ncbi:MAG: hypothetical protein MK006_15050 [Pirellulales bacterium]|nr:hypothetical protein [Pirellulales bacterium]
MTNQNDDTDVVAWIDSLEIPTRRYKSGRLHTVDFRPIAATVSDSYVERLIGLSKLSDLFLSGCGVTNRAIKSLLEHDSLQTIDLQDTTVDDSALQLLTQLDQLKLLILTGTNVSTEAVQLARKKMINTRIIKL